VADDGVVEMTIVFAPGETSRVIQGYSPKPPVVTAQTGTAGAVSFNPDTQRFQFSVSPSEAGTVVVQIAPR